MTARTSLALLLTLMLASFTALQAQPYKWVDEDGNVTYSQQKPPDVKAKTVKLRGVESVSSEQARERLDSLSDKAKTTRKDREFQATAISESQLRDKRLKENCESARQNLRILTAGSRVKSTDPEAGGGFMSDEQRAEQIEQARTNIENNCK